MNKKMLSRAKCPTNVRKYFLTQKAISLLVLVLGFYLSYGMKYIPLQSELLIIATGVVSFVLFFSTRKLTGNRYNIEKEKLPCLDFYMLEDSKLVKWLFTPYSDIEYRIEVEAQAQSLSDLKKRKEME